MRLENLILEYHEKLQDMKSFPEGSPIKKIYKDKLNDYLKLVRDKYGQDIVDEITNKKVRGSNRKIDNLI